MIVVVTDANILINLSLVGRLHLFGDLRPWSFVVPEEVVAEIVDPDQRAALLSAETQGWIARVTIDTLPALRLFAELRVEMGKGESACLAYAATSSCYLASDEKKRFRRRAIELIGEERILRTESVLLEAIRRGCLTVSEADDCKAVLAVNRYTMPFASFSDVLGDR